MSDHRENYTELLVGAGYRPYKKQVCQAGRPRDWKHVVSLDNNPDTNPDVVWDLSHHPLPFNDHTFDEIHAYDVLEHIAAQGDCAFFFAEFTEYHRILKPGGVFCATVPTPGEWFWCDPGHQRMITGGMLNFLSQEIYERDVGTTKMSDYRHIYNVNFAPLYAEICAHGKTLVFVLEARTK